jgi:hypothetical protein
MENMSPGQTKLGECEGDCDDDDDCEPGLYCYQRDSSDDVPPGCKAGGSGDKKTTDYCVAKVSAAAVEAPLPSLEMTEIGVGSCVPHPAISVLREETHVVLDGCKAACSEEALCSFITYGDADNSCSLLSGIPCNLNPDDTSFVTYGKPEWYFEYK